MSANVLKIIALITMTLDHVGLVFFPQCKWMRIVGRIAFPIFAFMIAEGCKYTHNRKKYLLQIGLMGIGMQVVFLIATGSLYQSVFISFSLAIMLIYVLDKAKSSENIKYWCYALLTASAITFLCLGLPKILHDTDYGIDYGIVGVLIPVLCYFTENRKAKIFVFALSLVALSAFYGDIQWYCLLTVPLIGMYNNTRGKLKMKNLFYIYYPTHLCIIYMLDMLSRQ